MKILLKLFIITIVIVVSFSNNLIKKSKIKDFRNIYNKRYLEPNITSTDTTSSDTTSSDTTSSDTTSSDTTSSDTTSSDTTSSDTTSSDTTSSNSTSSNSTSSDTTTSSTIPSTSPTTNFVENTNKILLGYDNYELSSNIIHFLAYIQYYSGSPDPYIIIVTKITRNLRVLEEISETFNCSFLSSNNSVSKYNCQKPVSGNISKVEVDKDKTDIKMTELAEKMGENLQNQKGNIISDKGIIYLRKCKTNKNNDMITCQIESGLESSSSINNKAVTLHIPQDDKILEVPATIRIDEQDVNILLENPKTAFSTDLNGLLGTIKDDKNIYLKSEDGGNSTTLNYKPLSTYNYKKSGGLSTGGIIAIIIPCILVLLGVAALTYFLGKKNTLLPNESVASNTMGINSSTNIVNK